MAQSNNTEFNGSGSDALNQRIAANNRHAATEMPASGTTNGSVSVKVAAGASKVEAVKIQGKTTAASMLQNIEGLDPDPLLTCNVPGLSSVQSLQLETELAKILVKHHFNKSAPSLPPKVTCSISNKAFTGQPNSGGNNNPQISAKATVSNLEINIFNPQLKFFNNQGYMVADKITGNLKLTIDGTITTTDTGDENSPTAERISINSN